MTSGCHEYEWVIHSCVFESPAAQAAGLFIVAKNEIRAQKLRRNSTQK